MVDLNQQRIDAWNSATSSPSTSPGWTRVVKAVPREELVLHHGRARAAIRGERRCIFVSVNTPTKKTGLGKGQGGGSDVLGVRGEDDRGVVEPDEQDHRREVHGAGADGGGDREGFAAELQHAGRRATSTSCPTRSFWRRGPRLTI